MNAVILMGIPASGKSTFFAERFAKTHVRINRDTLKSKHKVKRLLELCVELGIDFVSDNTNVSKNERAQFMAPAKDAGFDIVGYFFESKIEPCLARNALRNDEERLPDVGVRARRNALEMPKKNEGFDALYFVSVNSEGFFNVVEFSEE